MFFADTDSVFVEEGSEKELVVKSDNFLSFVVKPDSENSWGPVAVGAVKPSE